MNLANSTQRPPEYRYSSKILVPDEAVPLRVTLEDALDETLSAVVLLVGALIELVRALGAPACRCTTCCLTCGRFGFLGDGREWLLPRKFLGFLLFDLGADVGDLDLVLAEVDTVERDQRRDPNLELSAEQVIFGRLAGEHGIDRVFNQVEVLQVGVL